ncbi:TRAP transporter permease [Malaciobacter mytili]|uniref:TRAP transporter permease DctM/Q n=1 Tax=Malaciobacter mytili LMG 24559 TaxID=1032238 RepID=A0AAX2AGF7_9BACT|nr:TRAP transporter fused permease subunit [Malaciobacter mytili]AXH14648.1 TRAP transporter, small/large permease fusion protein [Malaciobacter mytili LMG 24559]RXK15108.1 TRAP transporter permease DctM/Q [Malaciobacter mytili LMG 24559]
MTKEIFKLLSAKYLIVATLAIITVGFHIYLIFTGLMPNLVSRPIHLLLVLPWIFLLTQDENISKFTKYLGYILLACAMFSSYYIIVNHIDLEEQYGSLEGTLQYFVAISLLLAVLEMARRAIKLALPLTAIIALAYGLFGHYIPGDFGHQEIPLDSFLGTLVIAEGGIYGSLTGISVNVVAVFVILGAFVGVGEGGNAFMSLSTKIAGRLRGGAAKVSVLASAFFGSISGSASANVASTGAFTIPTMKRLNYPASLAAASEAVASTGGQIMPPLMGAGAFIMAELLGVQYSFIMSSAIFPALLFFFTVWIGIDVFAKKYNLISISNNDIPKINLVLKLSPFFILPFGVLLYALIIIKKTPQFSAALAIFISISLLLVNKDWQFSFKEFIFKFLDGCISASKQIATIASVIICAGIIIGVLNITGVGVKITSAILYLSNGELFTALLLTAFACLILGMEVPTTAAYIICVSIAGPILQEYGLSAIQAHLFIFWFALLSTITPPVCGTVFIASGIAQVNWLKVAIKSMKLGLGLYLIPLSFIVNPYLIKPDTHFTLAFISFIKIGLGLWFISNALVNDKLKLIYRILLSLFGLIIVFFPL